MSTSSRRVARSLSLALGAFLGNALLLSALAGCATGGAAAQGELHAEAPRPAAESRPAESRPVATEGAPASPAAADGLAFTLPAASGQQVSRADLTRSGPAVIYFYRGSWCPTCRRQLKQINGVREALSQRGVGLAAISVDELDEEKRMVARLGLGFPVLSDGALEVARAYGAAEGSDEFAKPALVVLRRDGSVHWKQIGELASDESLAKLVLERAAEAGGQAR
jgi:peroxiredoxin